MKLRLLTILCVVYLGLLGYASLMSRELRIDRDAAVRRWERAWDTWPFEPGAPVSGSDAVSNFLLYVPLGALVATRLRFVPHLPRFLVATGVLLLASTLSAAVETCQIFLPPRVPSAKDWLLNSAGGLTGAVGGVLWGRAAWWKLVRWSRRRWRRRPLALAAVALLVLLAADALVPFYPTIQLRGVWRGLKGSHFVLAEGLAVRPWHEWLVTKAGVYAALTALLAGSSVSPWRTRWLRAAVLGAAVAAGLEVGKIFIVSRVFNVANVAVAVAGCGAAALLGAAWDGKVTPRGQKLLALGGLLVYIVYIQWTPFTFTWDPALVRSKLPSGPEWAPLYHYAMGARLEHARLFLRTLVLLGALVYVARLGGGWLDRGPRGARALKAALLAGAMGLFLEAGQLFLPRVPSVTDVTCFAVGGALGGWAGAPRVPARRVGPTGEEPMTASG